MSMVFASLSMLYLTSLNKICNHLNCTFQPFGSIGFNASAHLSSSENEIPNPSVPFGVLVSMFIISMNRLTRSGYIIIYLTLVVKNVVSFCGKKHYG